MRLKKSRLNLLSLVLLLRSSNYTFREPRDRIHNNYPEERKWRRISLKKELSERIVLFIFWNRIMRSQLEKIFNFLFFWANIVFFLYIIFLPLYFMEQNRWLTVDVIIAKFVPILGALLFITGLGYLIYTSVWEAMGQTMRLWVGFFVSIVIIGSAFSFSEKLRYFADVVMWGGILLLYGTLIYGSRTTDVALAVIPEVATIITAFIFTLFVAYFASFRKSKVILALGILGAYLTPFVIWQNDVWASNISYNAYLVYFAAVNMVIFFLWREIATHDLIPVNLGGLFFGTYTLHNLVYTDHVSVTWSGFFHSENFTLILLAVLVMMSIFAIAQSSRFFSAKEEWWISAWYLLPLFWFIFHVELLWSVSNIMESLTYVLIAVGYFLAWAYLRPLESTRYQHISSYAWGIIAMIFALNSFFPEFHLYARILVAYIGLGFSILYALEWNKWERLLAAFLLTCFGAILSLIEIYGTNSHVLYPTLFAIVALIPAALVAPLAKLNTKTPDSMMQFMHVYSITAAIIAGIILVIKFIQDLDFAFAFFILPGFLMVLKSYFQETKNPTRSTLMRIGVIWLSIGFFSSFLYFLSNFIPHVADDEHFWKNGGIFTNWHWIKWVFAIATYFLALSVSRSIQRENKVDRPSFLLVIIGYTTLLLVVNFMIITFCNDIGVAFTTGGPRAIGTTLWWIVLSIVMLMIGIHYGHGYRSEKLLGLLLLMLTVAKIALYDLASMDMNKKIIVLMVVGGIIMMFSYFLQVKGYLKDSEQK